MSVTVEADTVPRFGIGVKFRFDEVRGAWVVLAPERLFLPDEQAVEILKLVDGQRSLGAIVDDLAVRYQAPQELIATDVAVMLRDLADKGVIRL
ncbi:pyrroloquinoline quinone biosynthesis peptide chaperone PqqD [Nevskia soli]|uniref:pyrroloquinoline quinone biosynthesis peptide chaperone PqqD n=1 Tax=Nevskia soli TaxID=418856 RepID=UPI0004A7231A|nr:pyrroloquinoline quinone biosynthesis peptide chaperone PqqD [Nevskia soli]